MNVRGTTTQAPRATTRVDMHCHSSASQESRLGVQRAAGLPECATPPQEVYELSGLLCEPDAARLASALLELADSPLLREHLSRGALSAVAKRTWERTLERLADGYERALGGPASERAATAVLHDRAA